MTMMSPLLETVASDSGPPLPSALDLLWDRGDFP